MADLQQFAPKNDTITVELPLENDDGTPMTIEVYAPYSKEYKSVVHEQANSRIKKMQKNRKDYLTAEELYQAQLDLYVKITIDWDITWQGKKPKFKRDLAYEIYEGVFWVKDKIQEALDESVDFTSP
ncbi:MAG: hypothetical protein EYR95_18225 [Phormidium sp. SL48-SHIP]|nr:MAG: hypothetical protein EYR95_18225 [Phormidium sp. SL48-SHIP]